MVRYIQVQLQELQVTQVLEQAVILFQMQDRVLVQLTVQEEPVHPPAQMNCQHLPTYLSVEQLPTALVTEPELILDSGLPYFPPIYSLYSPVFYTNVSIIKDYFA
jgi:hypothetical protein